MLRQRLKPALDCLHRELVSAARAKSKVATLSQRTQDLEWLFDVAARLNSADSNRSALEQLLATATERMRSAFGALIVPGQRLLIESARAGSSDSAFTVIRAEVQPQLLAWAHRHPRPLIMNGAGTHSSRIAPCKLLSVSIMPTQGPALGALVFFNPPSAPDYVKRQAFLATDVARQAAQLLHSQYDLGTGLLTRGALEEAYRALPETMKSTPHSALFLDIDRLHVVNNVHGFSVGDDVILRVAQLLAPPILSREALVARIAGDEFVAILPNCDTGAAASIAAQLQRAVADISRSSLPDGIDITLSCGVTALSSNPLGLAAALVSAEEACKAAKERGRNRVETFTCDDASIIQRHGDALKLQLLEDALKYDRFELYGQPIVPLSNPELASGYEVLLRLRSQDGGVQGPAEFLSAAQRYQLMPSIDRWVLDHTLNLLETYSGVLVRRHVTVSVNVTGYSLADDKFVDYLLSRTKISRFPRRLLTIEITEQSAVRNLRAAVSMMKRVRAAGCGVALDDFGTGTNSLAYLRDLPVNRVKIDGSFVRDLVTNPQAESTLKGIVDLVRPFGVEIVAEYVENAVIAQKVRSLGIDYAQGYAFGKPVVLASVFEELKRDESRTMHRLALEI
jgi:diguanylate cyclase (GGDEF)-like protein